jgi:hypothetical protein
MHGRHAEPDSFVRRLFHQMPTLSLTCIETRAADKARPNPGERYTPYGLFMVQSPNRSRFLMVTAHIFLSDARIPSSILDNRAFLNRRL